MIDSFTRDAAFRMRPRHNSRQMDPARKRTVRLVVALSAAVLLAGALVYTSFSASSEARSPSQLLDSAESGRSYQLTDPVLLLTALTSLSSTLVNSTGSTTSYRPPGILLAFVEPWLGLVPFVGSVTGLYLLLDYLWPLWDDKKQAIHDKFAKTNVVRLR